MAITPASATPLPGDPNHESVLEPEVDLGARPAAAEDPRTPTPDIEKLDEAITETPGARALATTGLFLLAAFYTLYFARQFFLPLVFAILLDFLLSPVIRLLERARIRPAIGAAVVILALIGSLTLGVMQLAEPARGWIDRAPASLAKIGSKLRTIRQPVEQVTKTAEQVEQATSPTPNERNEVVVVRGPSLSQRVLGVTTSFLIALVETIILLYFLLAAGDLFLQKLIKVLPNLRDKKKAVHIARETEASVSTYLLTISLVNIGLGVIVGGAMWALRMPNPLLWGVLAGLLEFVPYLGAAVMLAVLTLASLATFDEVGRALLVPATYLVINFIQANFVYPMVLGNRLTLNPVAIFVGLLFWFMLWGIPGAFVAVPLIATFKIFCDHIETLAPVGEFLGK